jgi:hypothetical protein
VAGRCLFPKIQLVVPAVKGKSRVFKLKFRTQDCQALVHTATELSVPEREFQSARPRMTVGNGSRSQSIFKLLPLAKGVGKTHTVSWEPGSVQMMSFFSYFENSISASLESIMDYEFNAEWPGGLVVMNSHVSYPWVDTSDYFQVTGGADPYYLEEGPGSLITYWVGMTFDRDHDNPRLNEGTLFNTLWADGYGEPAFTCTYSLDPSDIGYVAEYYHSGFCSN